MNEESNLVNSIENVRSLINNSILILRDFDTFFSKKGLIPMLGNTIGTEASKSMNQSPDWMSSFFPQYMFRAYVERELTNEVTKIVAVNLQFYHPNHPYLEPLLIGGVITFPEPAPKTALKYWWLKYAVLEYFEIGELEPGKLYKVEPFSEDQTTVEFWVQPLTSLEDDKSVGAVVDRIVEKCSKSFI